MVTPRLVELAHAHTAMGELVLRGRYDPVARTYVHEVRLGEEYLMSSLFTVAEVALADLTLARTPGDGLAVLVGGLGLGCTAEAALHDPRVGRLAVVDALADVVDWHRRGLLPLSEALTGDPRTELVVDDVFAVLADGGAALHPPDGWDAVLLDVDHTPTHHLHPRHAAFYTASGLAALASRLRPGGTFGMWSDGGADPAFLALLRGAFAGARAHPVTFPNPLTGGTSTSTVYLAVRDR